MTRSIIILNLVGFVFVLNACKQTGTNAQEAGRKPGNSLLWKISGNGLQSESHLYGTIHIQDKRVFEYGETVEKILHNASLIAVEVELDKVDYRTVMEATLMKDSILEQLLTPDEFELLEEKYKQFTGVSLRTAQRVKPFFLSANIIQSIVKKDSPVPLDLYFIQTGRKKDKQVVGLESLTEQIAMIDKLSYSQQAKMLLQSLTDTIDITKMFDSMIEAYLNMDGEKLMELTTDPSIPEEFMKEILNGRNHIMAERLIPLLPQGNIFCAVGAAHLFGDEGIIELLRTAGYVVEPVEFDFKK
jgi:hypothetical protein